MRKGDQVVVHEGKFHHDSLFLLTGVHQSGRVSLYGKFDRSDKEGVIHLRKRRVQKKERYLRKDKHLLQFDKETRERSFIFV